ncbi:TPA: OTU domain-containing protein [Escherichia albertii]
MPLSKPINNFVSAIRDAFSGDCCKHRRSDNKNQMASGRKITVLSRDNITSPPGKQKISDGLSCGTTTSAHLLNVKSTVAFTQNITSDMATSPSLSVKRSTPPLTTLTTRREFMTKRQLPPPVPARPSKSTLAAFMNRNVAVSGGKGLPPPVPPRPSKSTLAAFMNRNAAVSGRDVPLSALIKPSSPQSVFSDSVSSSRLELKKQIIKALDLDYWQGPGGEIMPLVLIDFYKRHNINVNIYLNHCKVSNFDKNAINLINVGNHYNALTMNSRGNIERIDVPGDGNCLYHAVVKSHQITRKPKPYGNELQKDKPEWCILKESLKTHLDKDFDQFVEQVKCILISENTHEANKILDKVAQYSGVK